MFGLISYPPIPIFELGPLKLSLHGLAAGLGFLAGAWLLLRIARRRGFDTERLQSVLTWALVGALIGAPLLTVPARLFDPGFGIRDLFSSMSILGGMTGGIVGGWIRMRMLSMPFLPVIDMAAPGLALGTVIGRLGDLAIVEHLGRRTSFFLGYAVKPGYDLAPQHNALECTTSQAVDGICGIYHPTALYDLFGALVLLGVLLWLGKRWQTRHYGQLFAVWMAWYGFQRFFVDFTRAGGPNIDQMVGGVTWSQVTGFGAGLAGLTLLWVLWRRMPVVSAEQDDVYTSV
ncbi:prolipoprotein diacylglyceryl transferase [bacterium BMS3Abin02]|nr:prolipoprotein diacylglyceryl transferase [bacterium BMS3Abin02]GBE22158.1 prolipoprotein diacylglyceryl transferase [bacterium BMS3Bbin01]HDH25544.1 hypothetical protein [Actinomycetota bacterium]HDK45884.1 hypothetical protein [Actinomycetota bacterium]